VRRRAAAPKIAGAGADGRRKDSSHKADSGVKSPGSELRGTSTRAGEARENGVRAAESLAATSVAPPLLVNDSAGRGAREGRACCADQAGDIVGRRHRSASNWTTFLKLSISCGGIARSTSTSATACSVASHSPSKATVAGA
jgi:hypothetical protein